MKGKWKETERKCMGKLMEMKGKRKEMEGNERKINGHERKNGWK